MGDEGQEAETRGHRVYLIREALGTRRDPMSLPKFAELIEATSGVTYDKSTLSRMETGERKVSLEDIEAIAPVDPLRRGKAWLAGWDDERKEGNTTPIPAPTVPLEMFTPIATGDDLRRALGEPVEGEKKKKGRGRAS